MATPDDETNVWSKSYWNEPDLKIFGDQDPDKIRFAVGHALSNWEYVEEEISLLFMQLTECEPNSQSYTVVRRSFGAVDISSQRRKMLAAAAQVYFDEHWTKASGTFKKLIETIARASRRRDNIAHGTVIDSIASGNSGHIVIRSIQPGIGFKAGDVKNRGAFLVPASYNTERNFLPNEQDDDNILGFLPGIYRYTSEDILMFSEKFRTLKVAIVRYQQSIKKGLPDFPGQGLPK